MVRLCLAYSNQPLLPVDQQKIERSFTLLTPVDPPTTTAPALTKLPPIPKRWTPEDRAQVVAWYADGVRGGEITSRLGYSRFQVISAARRAGLAIREPSGR